MSDYSEGYGAGFADGEKAAADTITALTAEVERLKAVEADYYSREQDIIELEQEEARLTSRVKELEGALEFYGKPENWEAVWDHQFKMMVQEPAHQDKGDKARAALSASQPAQAPNYTEGHCAHKKAPGGCQLHNLHCGYPDCDRRLIPPAPQKDEEDEMDDYHGN